MQRVRPTEDANEVAAEQVKAFLRQPPQQVKAIPLFDFNAFSTTW